MAQLPRLCHTTTHSQSLLQSTTPRCLNFRHIRLLISTWRSLVVANHAGDKGIAMCNQNCTRHETCIAAYNMLSCNGDYYSQTIGSSANMCRVPSVYITRQLPVPLRIPVLEQRRARMRASHRQACHMQANCQKINVLFISARPTL